MRAPSWALLAALAAPLPPAAHAAFEETGFGARAMALSDAVTAVSDDLSALTVNPAAVGQLSHAQVEANSYRLFNIPAGLKEVNGMSFGAAVPLDAVPANGSLGISWVSDDVHGASLDRSLALTYATKNWREFGLSTLDAGASLKVLNRHGRDIPGHAARVAADLGILLRLSEDKSLGVAALNLNSPRTDLAALPDRAPFTLKAGYAQTLRRFLFSMDLTKREPSAGYGRGTVNGALGGEYVFATVGRGSIAGRSGMSLGRERSGSLGVGWRMLGLSLDYAIRFPLSHGSRWSNAVSLSYRFGTWDPEGEYERMISHEIDYRKDLARALDESGVRQNKLGEELNALRGEISRLRQELAARVAEKNATQERLKNAKEELRIQDLERRQEAAQRRLEQIRKEQEELRLRDKQGLYREDWSAYQELKRQGAAQEALIQRVNQILRQYKGTNVDLGEANQELQRLLRQ